MLRICDAIKSNIAKIMSLVVVLKDLRKRRIKEKTLYCKAMASGKGCPEQLTLVLLAN